MFFAAEIRAETRDAARTQAHKRCVHCVKKEHEVRVLSLGGVRCNLSQRTARSGCSTKHATGPSSEAIREA